MKKRGTDHIDLRLKMHLSYQRYQLVVDESVQLVINGSIPHYIDDLFDYSLFREAVKTASTEAKDYFIFTCSCNIPECGGYYKGVRIQKEGEFILVSDLDTDRSWRFGHQKVLKLIENIEKERNTMTPLLKQKNINYFKI